MGTPDFAVEPLRKLLEAGIHIAAVVTVPDKPSGRGQKIQQSAVKQFAIQNNLLVLQPDRLRDELFLDKLRVLNADLFVVVAFRMLPEVVWSMPPKGTINLHASLLPQYRGAAPINWAIINGESYTGVTSFFITHEIDTGDILLQERVEIIDDETAGELHDDLMNVGANLLLTTVKQIDDGSVKSMPQPYSSDLKKATKLFKDDCRINWNISVEQIHNLIRGLSPYPTAWSEMIGNDEQINVKIYKSKAEVVKHEYKTGTIISNGKTYMKIACNDGYINVIELQLAGKKRLNVNEFLIGFKQIGNFVFD